MLDNNERMNGTPENGGENQTAANQNIGNNYSCEPDRNAQTPIVLRTVPVKESTPENGAENEKNNKKHKNGTGRIVALAVCLCVVLSGVFGVGGGYLTANYLLAQNETQNSGTSDTPGTQTNGNKVNYQSVITTANAGTDSDSSQSAIANVAAATQDSVVEITTEVVTSGNYVFGEYVSEGAGSGVILTADGYIITNNHVIDGASSIMVRATDGTEYTATLVGTDAQTDIAVIKIEASGLKPAVLGDSDKLVVGEPTIVIGNPLGTLGGTVTNGIVSALNRTITIDGQKMTLLQTNAAVNPGNSGGGMFNINGELVGIINAKSSGTSSGTTIEGLGFAIPVNTAKDIADQLINYGYIKGRPALGVNIASVESANDYWKYRSSEIAQYITDYGVYITAYTNGDFQLGDRIIGIAGVTVETYADIKAEIANHSVGETISVTVSRNGRMADVEVTLSEYVPQTTSATSEG